MSVNTMSMSGGIEAYKAYGKKDVGKPNKKTDDYGRTVGTPKLSDTAKKYYEELKNKYADMDFILVSSDKMEQVKSQAGNYATGNKTVVLIDEAKIERMATDENYRKQYEGIIDNARTTLEQLKQSMESSGANVKGFGIQVNDNGTVSFFAALKKSSADQKARIERKAEEKKADRKAAEKKSEKHAAKERLENGQAEGREHVHGFGHPEDTVTLSASSVEELLQKLNDYTFAERSNQVQTAEELKVGQHIDFQA